jgi:hypothetical protein
MSRAATAHRRIIAAINVWNRIAISFSAVLPAHEEGDALGRPRRRYAGGGDLLELPDRADLKS